MIGPRGTGRAALRRTPVQFLLALAVLAAFDGRAWAQPVVVEIQPAEVVIPEVGQIAVVRIVAPVAPALRGFQVVFRFDPEVASVADVRPHPGLSITVRRSWDNETGTATIAAVGRDSLPEDDVVLAEIDIVGLADSLSPLRLEGLLLAGVGAVAVPADPRGAMLRIAGGTPREHVLVVSRAGDGRGRVTSSPAGIDCGSLCALSFRAGTQVSLLASPEGTSRFAGWSGDCIGAESCSVTMDGDRAVTARFDLFDDDGDGVANDVDLCPGTPAGDVPGVDTRGCGPSQRDTDLDGLADAVDNCVATVNPDQSDFNGDAEGDACDLDDGLILVRFSDDRTLRWQEERVFTSFNVYRGDLGVLRTTGVYTQDPAVVPLALRACDVSGGSLDDPAVPPPGDAAFYLVTGVGFGIEYGLGSDSADNERPNTRPCP